MAQEILLGGDNVSNIPWQGLGDRFNKAELFGKLANIFADLPSKAIDDNGMFKVLTSEDYITAERKNRDPFSFRPYARFLFSCNEIPRNYGDRSIWFYMKESDIAAAILRLLKKMPCCFAWKEHGGMYGTAGIPDIIACIHGQFVAFEVKTAGGRGTAPGKLSKLQEITIQKIQNAKGQAFKVILAAEVAAILKMLEGLPYE